MKIHTKRLTPNQDLKTELDRWVQELQIRSGLILCGVGSLQKATLRLADENIIKTWHEKFEIVSVTGTLSTHGNHIHLSISNNKGQTLGGHLKEGCLIHTTCELIIGKIDEVTFSREYDPETGFKELVIKENTSK